MPDFELELAGAERYPRDEPDTASSGAQTKGVLMAFTRERPMSDPSRDSALELAVPCEIPTGSAERSPSFTITKLFAGASLLPPRAILFCPQGCTKRTPDGTFRPDDLCR
jgi:hypothetical protein